MTPLRRDTARQLAAAVAVAALGAAVAACNSSSAGDSPSSNATGNYTVTTLVSNRGSIPARHQDGNLVNPWGLAFGPDYAWVANNGSQRITVYDGNGVAQTTVATVPAGTRPTGLVYNGSASDFQVTARGVTGPARFILAGQNGTLAAWSDVTGFGNAFVTVYNSGTDDAQYTGLALLESGGGRFLYAADFHNGRIDTFDTGFHKVASAGGFTDPTLPAGYAPFNIQAVQDRLIVTYAKQQAPDNEEEEAGPGLGYVSEFDGSGRFQRRLVSGGELNAPWGVALAPANFGALSNKLLIGNFGDGRINAYDLGTGAFAGTLQDADGIPVVIPGLWALAFGNGAQGQAANALFFTAGTNDEADGSYGRIDVAGSEGGNGSSNGGNGNTGSSGNNGGSNGTGEAGGSGDTGGTGTMGGGSGGRVSSPGSGI